MDNTDVYLTFKISDTSYGVPVSQVQAVYNDDKVSRIPGASHYITGVLNFMGRLVPVFNLEGWLKNESLSHEDKLYRTIVVKYKNENIAIVIDELLDLETFEDFGGSEMLETDIPLEHIDKAGIGSSVFALIDVEHIMDELTGANLTEK